MLNSPFAPLLESQEEGERRSPMVGLRFAEVVRIEDEGHILTWLSGSVTTESAPARVATMMAGGERGTFFAPEVGDEVVVGFEDGDLDKPVILGALWSDVDQPPADADTSESNNIRTIVSRLGHQLTFDDTQGAGKVLLKSNAEQQVLFEDEAAGGKITIKTKNNLQIVMDDAAGSITIEVDPSNKIELSAAGITVTGAVINLN